jgi:hypothetical protein
MIIRVWNTALFWTWMVNGLRLASTILVVPIWMRVLSEADSSMYLQFVFLSGFGYTLDSMFATTIMRYVSYATRGLRDIQSIGLSEDAILSEQPNYVLLGQLFSATKLLYSMICVVILFLLGVGGTLTIYRLAAQTSHPTITWAAWGVTVAGSCLELYTGYWLVFLRGMDRIVLSSRLSAGIYGLKLLLSVILLLSNFGLLAVPIATLLTSTAQRLLARRFIRDAVPERFRKDHSRDRELVGRIWPTSWRMGLVGLSYNVLLVGFGAIIPETLGAKVAYRYQVSYQIMHSVCGGMAAVWTFVKWPLVMQLRVAHNFEGLRRLLWPRVWLQTITFMALAGGAVALGQPLLDVIAPNRYLLPRFWLTLLAVQALLETTYIFWTTLLTSENRIPSLWAAVVTNGVNLVLGYIFVKTTNIGLGAFVLAPLISGLCFNYWYWPKVGARSLGLSWFRFMFRRPAHR